MKYLLDTNVISEFRKNKPHGAVLAWRKSVATEEIFIPSVVIGEIQYGIELTRRQHLSKAFEIENWLERILAWYQIIPADAAIYREWGRLIVGKSIALNEDALIAATARVHYLIVVTRNCRDFEGFGVPTFDPFTFAA